LNKFSLFVSTIKEKNTLSDFLLIIIDPYIESFNFSGQINSTQSLDPSFPCWSLNVVNVWDTYGSTLKPEPTHLK